MEVAYPPPQSRRTPPTTKASRGRRRKETRDLPRQEAQRPLQRGDRDHRRRATPPLPHSANQARQRWANRPLATEAPHHQSKADPLPGTEDRHPLPRRATRRMVTASQPRPRVRANPRQNLRPRWASPLPPRPKVGRLASSEPQAPWGWADRARRNQLATGDRFHQTRPHHPRQDWAGHRNLRLSSLLQRELADLQSRHRASRRALEGLRNRPRNLLATASRQSRRSHHWASRRFAHRRQPGGRGRNHPWCSIQRVQASRLQRMEPRGGRHPNQHLAPHPQPREGRFLQSPGRRQASVRALVPAEPDEECHRREQCQRRAG